MKTIKMFGALIGFLLLFGAIIYFLFILPKQTTLMSTPSSSFHPKPGVYCTMVSAGGQVALSCVKE